MLTHSQVYLSLRNLPDRSCVINPYIGFWSGVPFMPFHEILKQTLSALWETKLRSFLTMFGIVWGITSVILLVGLGIGFNADQKQRLRSIGTDIAIFFGGKTGAQAGGYAAGRDIRLTIADAIAIRDRATLVKTVSPELRRTVSEVSQGTASSRPVRGVSSGV